ncbi:amyloid-beta A4 precursor protein-binding family B member 3 isoform X1 [Paramormyrops kingsleyae]|uniref:amyloid-beta A4 precursor protein-binding family B member 3 isoform X1 n=1 Tax=Paramormyrops kingsleyae TaxID=1676925 RepID=UPI000CD6168F|nr:amyloid-beta A4 precursor protein-binding family B member 3-like isoform X2 [Paramormyrops kingsleyae]
MLGKDYMLAIIIVNYNDNIWNDQDLDLDSDLPPGWRTIRDSTGTYYWHVPTGATQWHHPSHDAEGDPSSALTGASKRRRFSASTEQGSEIRGTMSPTSTLRDRGSLPWHEDHFYTNNDPDSKCFAVRSLGWVEIPEEDLAPGKSSIAVNNCIQQLSYSKCEGRDAAGAWGEGQDMVMVLKKDTLSLVDPADHSLIHCQPIVSIRVWGVGCNKGRDFAFVASDKDTCMLKCHVFRCNVPAKAITVALHDMCSKIMSEKAKMQPPMPRSVTMESISPEDLPRHVDFLDAVRQREQMFPVEYIGQMAVPQAMGMEVLNRAIENVMNMTDRDEWEPTVLRVSDAVLSLWRGEDGDDPLWESQVRYLTFLGVGHDRHTFAVIVDGGTQRFQCHVFWCEPDAGFISEAVQAACMVQYQKCLVAQTPPLKSKMWRSGSKVKRTSSVDSTSLLPPHSGLSPPKFGTTNVRKSMLAFFEAFRNKPSPVPAP